MPIDKRQPYETDIRVPLLIRGPGIIPSKISAPVSSVDLFATILEIAGIQHSSDGTSVLKKKLSKDRTLLIEYRGERSKNLPSSGCPSDYDPNLTVCIRAIETIVHTIFKIYLILLKFITFTVMYERYGMQMSRCCK